MSSGRTNAASTGELKTVAVGIDLSYEKHVTYLAISAEGYLIPKKIESNIQNIHSLDIVQNSVLTVSNTSSVISCSGDIVKLANRTFLIKGEGSIYT